jgi:myo-inositol catabolism protein IolC
MAASSRKEAKVDEFRRRRVADGAPRLARRRVSGPIFVEPARKGTAGAIDDAAATRAMAESFARLVAMWQDVAPGGTA